MNSEAKVTDDNVEKSTERRRKMTLKIWQVIRIILSALVAGMFCGAMGGFEQIPQHFRAGSLSGNRTPDEPKYGSSHDHPDARCLVVDHSSSGPLVQTPTKDLLSDLGRIRLVHHYPIRDRAC